MHYPYSCSYSSSSSEWNFNGLLKNMLIITWKKKMSESDINSSHGNFLFISFSPLQWLYSIKAGLVHNCQALYNNFRQSFLGHSALTILDLVVLCEGWALTG